MKPDGRAGVPGPGQPAGFLVAIGGNEDKEFGKLVLKTLITLPEGGTKVVEVIPTASSIPKRVSDDYVKAFTALGVETVQVMPILDRDHADSQAYADRVRAADLIYFTGGDQLRLTSLLGGTRTARAIRDHYWNGGVVAGTSAGAAAMSGTMIFEGDPNGGMRKGNVQMTPGLGLVRNCVIDTHFLDRGRLSRLLEVVTSNPGYIGLGLGEDTAIVIRNGDRVEVFGKGLVVVVDGHQMRYSNITRIDLREPIAAEHIIVHTLVAGHGYDLAEQKYLAPPQPLEESA